MANKVTRHRNGTRAVPPGQQRSVAPETPVEINGFLHRETPPGPRNPDDGVGRSRYGWGEAQAKSDPEEKAALADCFKVHDFLIPVGGNPEGQRLGDASILVTTGSTQCAVVAAALAWMGENWHRKGPFCVMWYTPGARVATELRKFKSTHHDYRSSADLFLFPGQVDQDVESVLGDVPVQFAHQQLKSTRFTYAILSVHRLDLETGQAYFHFSNEISLQRACADLYAAHKYLFVTPKKLDSMEGQAGYTIHDLLKTSEAVTIYTVASDERRARQDVSRIKKQFSSLCGRLLSDARHPVHQGSHETGGDSGDVMEERIFSAVRPAARDRRHDRREQPETKKRLRLCITDLSGEPVYDKTERGYLIPQGPTAPA